MNDQQSSPVDEQEVDQTAEAAVETQEPEEGDIDSSLDADGDGIEDESDDSEVEEDGVESEEDDSEEEDEEDDE